jgi:GT2 family glycosyltransferase
MYEKKNLVVGWFGYGGHSWQAEQYRDALTNMGHTLRTCHEYPNADFPYSKDTIKQFIDSCDVLIFPTRAAQPAKSSNRLVLAWSRRKPCIVSKLDAFMRIVEPGKNALVADDNDYAEDDGIHYGFLSRIEELAIDSDMRERIANGGYQRAMMDADSYNPVNYAKKYSSALSKAFPHVHVIIPHYAPRVDYITHAVASVLKSKGVRVTVTVSSSSPVKPEFNNPQVQVYHQNENMTFSRANNKALSMTPADAGYVLLLNDDAFVSEWSIKRMVDVAKAQDDNVILNPYSNCDRGWLHDDGINIAGKQLVPAMNITDFSDEEIDILMRSQFSDDPTFIESPFAAFYSTLIPRKIMEHVGVLSEEFRNGGEDADYCFRAKALGYKVGWTRSAFVFHFGGKSRKVSHETRGEDHVLEDLYNNSHLAKKWPRHGKRICIYTGPAWEKWNIDTPYKTGIGGSEYCAGQLARVLAKYGHSVTMYGDHPEMEQDGVMLRHWTKYVPDQEYYDLLVASRSLASIASARAKNVVAWVHDIWLLDGQHLNQALVDKVTKFACLSPWHVDFFSQHHGIPKDKIAIIPNGMDTSMLRFDADKKVFGKLHYSSSPDRGLDNILYMLPFIKEHVPELHLDVYYGFHNWKSAVQSRNNSDEMRRLEGLLSDLDKCKDFVHFKDRVNLPQLHEAWNKAYTWFFPTLFTETFCITAKEAQYSGTPIVCSDVAALKTTVGKHGMQVPFPYSGEGRQAFIDEIVKLHKDRDYWYDRALDSFAGAKNMGWDHVYHTYWKGLL